MNKDVFNRFKSKILNMNSNELLCLYIDYPFCKSKCEYCIYNTIPYKEGIRYRNQYVSAAIKQLKEIRPLLDIRTPDAIYFGGGTPSLWSIEELSTIVDNIPNYERIRSKKSETHPSDLTDERIKFYSDCMKLDVASIGVQSFYRSACIGQKRIWVNEEQLKHIVDEFHKYHIFVNIDLVALFNGDEDKDWNIFDKDVDIACNYVRPDIITSIPNYKTKLNYLEQLPRYRSILKKYVGEEYFPLFPKMLSLEWDDIKKYGENDHWIATKKFWEYQDRSVRYSSSHPDPEPPLNQVTISIGGAGNHMVYS